MAVDNSRRVMICSVSVLGIGIMIFMFSYMVFGDDSDENIRTLRMTNVSVINILHFHN